MSGMSEKPSPEMEALERMLELVEFYIARYGATAGREELLADAKKIVESVKPPPKLDIYGALHGDILRADVGARGIRVEVDESSRPASRIILMKPEEAKQVGNTLLAMANWLERQKA